MSKDRCGIIVNPYTHRGWKVEMLVHPNPNGCHLFIFDPHGKNDITYFDISEDLVCQQVEQDQFEIKWIE